MLLSEDFISDKIGVRLSCIEKRERFFSFLHSFNNLEFVALQLYSIPEFMCFVFCL